MERPQRKKYLLNPSFQLKFITYFLGFYLSTIVIILIAINFFFFKFQKMGVEANLPQKHIFFVFIHDQQLQLNFLIGIVSFIAIILVAVGGIFLSHKIVGPIYRFCSDLKKMDKTNIREIHFRKNDFFDEIADTFNNFIKRL